MPGRSSSVPNCLPSTVNLKPGGTVYCLFSPFSRVAIMVVGLDQTSLPLVIVVVRLTSGVSVVVTAAVSIVPTLSWLSDFFTPSIVATAPGLTSKKRYSPPGTILARSQLGPTAMTSPLSCVVVAMDGPLGTVSFFWVACGASPATFTAARHTRTVASPSLVLMKDIASSLEVGPFAVGRHCAG